MGLSKQQLRKLEKRLAAKNKKIAATTKPPQDKPQDKPEGKGKPGKKPKVE
jgi:hypothetical protein